MDDGVDALTRLPTAVGIGDVETNDIVVLTRRSGKRIGVVQIGQAEAVALAVRVPERGTDAAGGAGEQYEAALGLNHASGTPKRVEPVERSGPTRPELDRRSCSAPELHDLVEHGAFPHFSVQGSCHSSPGRISHKLAKFGAVCAGALQPRDGRAVV